MTNLPQETINELNAYAKSLPNEKLADTLVGVYYFQKNPTAFEKYGKTSVEVIAESLPIMENILLQEAQLRGFDIARIKGQAAALPFELSSESQLRYAESLKKLREIQNKSRNKKIVTVVAIVVIAAIAYYYFKK